MLRLAVRNLAEFVHRRGDLHARLDGRTRAEEGIATQRRLQRGCGDGYQRERPVALRVILAGVPVTISGRVDGCDVSGGVVLVEEFKTTRADAQRSHDHHASAHWAQALLYAGLLGRELDDGRGYLLRLVYAHPDTLETRRYERRVDADEAECFLAETLAGYGEWLSRQNRHEVARNAVLEDLTFPYPEFRPFQRTMARRAFRALRDREHLLLEAPTGSGKTAATLYPALRALQASGYRRILFLTSRNTGALAARDAAARMDPERGFLRHATITARDKACFVPGTPCEPEACAYARGYYDRSRAAVVELLDARAADPERIATVARRHRVCPFELSLDTALWCDLVIADYNYVFDPVVRLQRFAADPEAALLVDEAHQLAPRVRDMLSLAIERRELRAALAEPLPEPVARRVRSLDRALTTLKRDQSLGEERLIERPEALLRAMQRFVDELALMEQPLEALPETRALLFNCSRWLRSDAWYDPDRFRYLGEACGRAVGVRLVCIDPGAYLRERFDDYGGHVRFSGTVSPLDLYARLHGAPQAPAERAGNPFRADQLKVLVVDDVPTYLRRRSASVMALARLIDSVIAARSGHYLVALPSFDYLEMAADAYRSIRPDRPAVRQRPGMDEAARAAFLSAFEATAPPGVGFVVLGGVFGESVDFTRARLAGVICVGVGLPPPSLTRQALAEYFSDQGVDGAAVAYHQPAMVKVLQMAGRLLRDPADRGVLCLVDARFRENAYRQFFPAHWRPEAMSAARVGDALAGFWRGPASA
ncbi:MAG: ATP-dependent DNA helicase [Roseibium album]|uniref:ATP-dependent DNA helicase n=1 Tax=Roseibium album TaxID=311410 RepID=UPI0032EDCFBC